MSDRYLYRRIPVAQRNCSWCQRAILRNIARTKDGRLWHYGCLMTAKDARFQCSECVGSFDGTEVTLELKQSTYGDDFRQIMKAFCPSCGGPAKSLIGQGGIEF